MLTKMTIRKYTAADCQNSKVKYYLTWKPSDEYLKTAPVQISMFGRMMKEAKC